jgi:hypothetical protein
LATGVVTALVLRHFTNDTLLGRSPHWWHVVGLYGLSAGIIFIVVIALARVGPHGNVCWRDLRVIAGRFLPIKAG